MDKKVYGAVDFGATSGRVAEVTLSKEGILDFDVVYRFRDLSVQVFENFYTCSYAFYAEALEGLSRLGHKYAEVASIGVDSWGVDFILFDKHDFMVPSHLNSRAPWEIGRAHV